ncbi:MAG: hypothetical protein HZA54_13165 [Planctomycetes bacterium]|nr:hypothetical protein [Planctomycetota bacterium]
MSAPDPYLEVVHEHWAEIVTLYRAFEERRPVMLYDLQERRIYAYPYAAYRAELSPRSRKLLTAQYREAKKEDRIVVFVRDNEKKKLVSYCLA